MLSTDLRMTLINRAHEKKFNCNNATALRIWVVKKEEGENKLVEVFDAFLLHWVYNPMRPTDAFYKGLLWHDIFNNAVHAI